jgi:putative phosphoribosyl transferase
VSAHAAGEVDQELSVIDGEATLSGRLRVPAGAQGVVLFAHGSGSGRFSPRNRSVADALWDDRLGSLLFDLLEEREALVRRHVFDIALLARRLLAARARLAELPATRSLPIGYFGASTGAAAALVAAAERPDVGAVVSRGGRPDLAGHSLAAVRAPTLLIVGGRDLDVLSLNQAALRALRAEKELAVVPGATHLFEEPGALERVAELARGWFARHLSAG